jgi:hypothetical protein
MYTVRLGADESLLCGSSHQFRPLATDSCHVRSTMYKRELDPVSDLVNGLFLIERPYLHGTFGCGRVTTMWILTPISVACNWILSRSFDYIQERLV